MRNSRLYYYPCPSKSGYGNPYSVYYKEVLGHYYNVINSLNTPTKSRVISLLVNSLKADIYVLNWLEEVGVAHLPFIQYLLVRLALYIIKRRGARIIWMYHNINSHHGNNKITQKLRFYLLKNSSLIISHSKDGCDNVKAEGGWAVYKCHPIKPVKYNKYSLDNKKQYDALIWGEISPYKGIVEFLENVGKGSGKKIKIIGNCKNDQLRDSIFNMCDDNITFENRRADTSEISRLCKNSKIVIFPYIGESISSSGAFIETIAMDGVPVGPNRGAFKDLKSEGVCYTYNTYDELKILLDSNIKIQDEDRKNFIKNNSWDEFGKFFFSLVGK